MFPSKVYTERRKALLKKLSAGLILIPGNSEVPYNYQANTYHFRQDSTFSYFFGLNDPNLVGVIDIEDENEFIFGDNIDMEDIIWMGNLPSVDERAAKVGIVKTFALKELTSVIKKANSHGRKIHFLPPYRGESLLQLENLLGISKTEISKTVSIELIKAVIELRLVKDKYEITETERMLDVAYLMHTQVMKLAKPGVSEKEIAGIIEGIALSNASGVSFPIILSMNGETLHNHVHTNILQNGRLLITDAGSESELLYASDITRTIPVSGEFSPIQRNIYNIVLEANLKVLELASPNNTYLDVHIGASKVIATGLKDLGLMKGNIDDAVEAGAHALFFPHGVGHALGMDVHDLEGLGEDFIGYDESIIRSKQFGLAYLRFAKKPKPGYILTDEPGIYFIPELIDLWRSEKRYMDFINYDKVDSYKGFGGIRIEDDILITEQGCRVLGKPIPKRVEEIEDMMKF